MIQVNLGSDAMVQLGGILGRENPGPYEIYALMLALQDVLVDGDAIIITEVGFDGLHRLFGSSIVITKQDTQVLELHSEPLKLARAMLGTPEFTTEMGF
jgi:hypothetical protein